MLGCAGVRMKMSSRSYRDDACACARSPVVSRVSALAYALSACVQLSQSARVCMRQRTCAPGRPCVSASVVVLVNAFTTIMHGGGGAEIAKPLL